MIHVDSFHVRSRLSGNPFLFFGSEASEEAGFRLLYVVHRDQVVFLFPAHPDSCSSVIPLRVSEILSTMTVHTSLVGQTDTRGHVEASFMHWTRQVSPSRTSTMSLSVICAGSRDRTYPPWAPRVEVISPAARRGMTIRLRYSPKFPAPGRSPSGRLAPGRIFRQGLHHPDSVAGFRGQSHRRSNVRLFTLPVW